MDNSPENGRSVPALSPAKFLQSERRGVRRKLIQSTLFSHKPLDNGGAKGSRGCDEEVNGDNEECCGSQSKRKRKRKPKASPSKTPKKVKGKSPVSTPDKNLTCAEIEDATPVIPDLRSEARIAAEENSRMFAGKKIHPFFSSWKAGKNTREVTHTENDGFQVGRKDRGLTCGPIHVFESTTNNDVSLDWRTWTFCEETFIKSRCLESSPSSIFEGSVECLSFDKFPIVSHPSNTWNFQNGASPDKVCTQQECLGELVPILFDISDDEQVICYQPLKETEVSEVHRNTDSERNRVLGEQSRFHEERAMPRFCCCDNQLGNSLWIHKYQPRKAVEVCGNDESVKFLGEWLRLWRERDTQISKICTESDSSGMYAEEYICSETEYDSDSEDAASLKNVLLVTGPVGSGKSAAIYACAQEQGFEVLEVSASECRNGAIVKQRFGEALESHRVKRSLAKSLSPQNMCDAKSCSNLVNGIAIQELDGVPELTHSKNIDLHNETGVSGSSHGKETVNSCWQNEIKPLILFEDVDVTFIEDRGFVPAIQHISKTAKGPIILTSNSHNPLLPGNMKKEQVDFTLPSSKELLSHLHMICAAEKVDIKSHLLERFVECCQGDIRKTIMQLQFWCQGRSKRARKMKGTYGSLLFDLDAAHRLLPKLIPWDLPSQLSELIENEISRLLSMEGNSSFLEVVDEEFEDKEAQLRLNLYNIEPDSIHAKKAALLNRNSCLHDFDDFTAMVDVSSMFSDNTSTSFALCRRNARRKHVVLSDSEDETCNNGHATISVKGIESGALLEASVASDMLPCSLEASMDEKIYQWEEAVNLVFINNTCDSLNVSCVPESTFVPESEFGSGTDHLSGVVSCGNLACTTQEVYVSNRVQAEDLSECRVEMDLLSSHTLVDNTDVDAEFCNRENVEDSYSGQMETVAREYQVMDESSRIDFNGGSKSINPIFFGGCDTVQEAWSKFRGCHTDLRHCILSERQHSREILKLTHGMSNLISETDILFSSCQLQWGDFLAVELDAYNLSDERLLLASTIAQHGFCLYSKHIPALGSSTYRVSNMDLASEMLASATGLMALGKLVGEDIKPSKPSYGGRKCLDLAQLKTDVPFKSDIKSGLFNVVQTITPSKSILALRGVAYYEYLSSLCHISRSEASRISQNIDKRGKRRRGRIAQHYLSTGRMMLSPEQISMLDQHNLQTANCSQSISTE